MSRPPARGGRHAALSTEYFRFACMQSTCFGRQQSTCMRQCGRPALRQQHACMLPCDYKGYPIGQPMDDILAEGHAGCSPSALMVTSNTCTRAFHVLHAQVRAQPGGPPLPPFRPAPATCTSGTVARKTCRWWCAYQNGPSSGPRLVFVMGVAGSRREAASKFLFTTSAPQVPPIMHEDPGRHSIDMLRPPASAMLRHVWLGTGKHAGRV